MDQAGGQAPMGGVERSLVTAVVASAGTGAVVLAGFQLAAGWAGGLVGLAVGVALTAGWQWRQRGVDAQQRAAVAQSLERLARGGDVALDPAALGAYAALGAQVNAAAKALRASNQRVGTLAASLSELPNQIAGALAEFDRAAEDQEAAVEETSSLLANINGSIRGVNEEITSLARSNEEAASSIMEMGSAIEQVAGSATTLRDNVESSTSSVHELNAQIRRVAESGDSVQQGAEETATSISQMDQAIREVGDHVRGASELTEQVSESADEGARAVGATIEGIAQISELTRDAKTALEGLADRIGEIGAIASVINGISDETNLLSLNAAIIAAQAGEHGKAFAVVAEQVKTLARRTTQSTKEIESLIEAVQQQSANAVVAMGAGIDAVEQGVTRSRAAGESLDRIRTSARDASGRVAEIARAAEEQARNSRHVAQSAQRTSDQVQTISTALSEQSLATEQLLKNSTDSLEMCRQMSSATEEQRSSSRYISENITAITEMIASIQRNTANHERASEGVAESVISILENARKSSERIPVVARAVVAMRERAEEMNAALHGAAETAEATRETGPDQLDDSATQSPA